MLAIVIVAISLVAIGAIVGIKPVALCLSSTSHPSHLLAFGSIYRSGAGASDARNRDEWAAYGKHKTQTVRFANPAAIVQVVGN